MLTLTLPFFAGYAFADAVDVAGIVTSYACCHYAQTLCYHERLRFARFFFDIFKMPF